MPTITLSTKIRHRSQLKLADKFLKSTLKGLKVEMKIRGVSSNGWIQTEISGEDEKVALRYLAEEIGLCPTSFESMEKFSTAKGYIIGFNKEELHVDIGIFSPSVIDAAILLRSLQAQLVDGRKMALKKIAELFGLAENTPLWVKILSVNGKNTHVETVLSERQLALYRNWTKSLLDRLIVLGASFSEVMLALKRARCKRDVVRIELLGLFEHAVVCKLGTDAAGLIPRIGGKLWSASFSIFNPRRIIEFLGDSSMSFV